METPSVRRPWDNVERMLSVDDALTHVLASFQPLAPQPIPLLEALGLVLAEQVVATANVPPFRNAAMDGYAVLAAETTHAAADRPVRLRLIADVAAGRVSEIPLSAGSAIRIMTGAPVPDGADAVVRFEETEESERTAGGDERANRMVMIYRPVSSNENVRAAGEDIRLGQPLLSPGTPLRPAQIGLLASLNRPTVSVHRRPHVGILSTGDEVVDIGHALMPGQIRNSNSYTLAAMATSFGARPCLLGIAPDTVRDLTEKLEAAPPLDLIVTSGGVSVGDFDLVKDVLAAQGEIAIWQVRMKPGKPLAFGRLGRTPLLGLPGNPVAAAVSFELFGRPAIRTMLGHRHVAPPSVNAILTERIDNRGQRRHYVRARVERDADGNLLAHVVGEQGAGMLTSLAQANGLLIVPEQLSVAEPGMTLRVQMLDWDPFERSGDGVVTQTTERTSTTEVEGVNRPSGVTPDTG